MNHALLTIIIPAYNVEQYIIECFESLVHQTIHNHFVIVVDDGSTDRTAEICDAYMQKYPQLFYCIHQQNKGQGAARNAALKLVHTEYVTFLDSDDWLDLNFVASVQRLIEQHSLRELDIIYTLPKIYDSTTGLFTDWYDKALFLDIFFAQEKLVSASRDMRMYDLEYSACRKVFRTEFLKHINFSFEEGVKWEDIFPHFYCTYHAKSCIGLAEAGFTYRKNIAAQTTSSSGKSRLDAIYVFDKTINFFEQENIDTDTKTAILSKLISFLIWSVDESNQETKVELSQELGRRFKKISFSDWLLLWRGKCSLKTKLFVLIMQNRLLRKCYTDSLIKSTIMNPLKKVKKVFYHG